MKKHTFKVSLLAAAVGLASAPAMAAELRFDGFASFVAGQVLDKDELATDSSGDPVLFRGFDDKLSFNENSLFAVQVRADLQDRLSATAQIIAKGNDGYDAKFNWAYLSYELTDEVT